MSDNKDHGTPGVELDPLDMGHEADGIRELDNSLPRWWLWLFYLSIFYGIIYLLVYHVFRVAPLQEEQWRLEMAAAQKQMEAAVAAAGGPREVATEASSDPTVLALGKEIFSSKATCWTCHGPEGGGMPALGPNLTDTFKINGHAFADTLKVITDGSPRNPVMIPWKSMLKPDELFAVASYVWNMKGSTPSNPIPPEGVDEKGNTPSGAPAAPQPGEEKKEETVIQQATPAPAPDTPSADAAVLAHGKEIFTTKSTCWTCHAPDGGGMPALGPNLTDDYKVTGHSFGDMVKVITDGSPRNPVMIPWKSMLKPDDIYAVASYVWSLKGTTPANPIPPEGVNAEGKSPPPASGS